MNVKHFILSVGSLAAVASAVTGCSKNPAEQATSSLKEGTSAVKSIAHQHGGGYKEDIKVVDKTEIHGVTLDSNAKPELKPFLNTYAKYDYEKGEVFGGPKLVNGELIQHFDGKADQTYIEFAAHNPDDKHFHAITFKKGSPHAYAVWGVIGDAFKKNHAKWGLPTGLENEDVDSKTKQHVFSQEFENGSVTWNGNPNKEPEFKNR